MQAQRSTKEGGNFAIAGSRGGSPWCTFGDFPASGKSPWVPSMVFAMLSRERLHIQGVGAAVPEKYWGPGWTVHGASNEKEVKAPLFRYCGFQTCAKMSLSTSMASRSL